MLTDYHQNPILGIYYFAHYGDRMQRDLEEVAAAGIKALWLFFDPAYDRDDRASLHTLLDEAERQGLKVVPVLGQFLQLEDHPEVKIVNADGTTSDNPRYWNMGCFRQPTVKRLAKERATAFMRDFGDHPALYRMEEVPVMSFVHEAYYRNSVPEFGGGPMMPNCYCDHCLDAFADCLEVQGMDRSTPAPRDASDPVLWQNWIDCHAQAIPDFLADLIAATREVAPVWSTHECNDFYPASWQSVYTGNDWWRMGAVLDFGHEDMYPLEFDHRYQCYVFDYAKDVMRSATNFKRLVTANGQAFNSWLGYQLPEGSMSEQVYSAVAHGSLGLVWWGQWPDDDSRYDLTRQTEKANQDFLALVEALGEYEPPRAQVALLYSWTSMSQELNDNHTYDTLFAYMMLVQNGYSVDILSEDQVGKGVLEQRGHRVLLAMGCSALPEATHTAVDAFVQTGGLLITDYAPHLNDALPPLCAAWRSDGGSDLRILTLPDNTPVTVQLAAAPLNPPDGAEILAHFNDGSPAAARIAHGSGTVILIGSYMGWDYTDYPGYYDLAAMFPFHPRRDAKLREWLASLMAKIQPPVKSRHADVETAMWSADDNRHILIAINHLRETIEATIDLPTGKWQIEPVTDDVIVAQDDRTITVSLSSLQGCALRLLPIGK